MYTVVIAEKEHIEAFDEYAMYLEPFRKKTQFALCMWNPEASGSLYDLVPELERLVDRREEWRAIILCDERGLAKRNPFNVIEYREEIWQEQAGDTLALADYFQRRGEAKEEAYRQAAGEPLVRLVTFLCDDPVLTRRGDEFCEKMPEMELDGLTLNEAEVTREHLEYVEYRRMAQLKKELREKIRATEKQELRKFHAPAEVLCIAKRHNVKPDKEYENVWGDHDEREYSRFYDWNLYFDRMRYLLFDITDKSQLNYRSEYIRFLAAVSVIASNEAPSGCMRPHRVYRLICEADQEKMALMLMRYFEKLDVTKEAVLEKIEQVRQTEVKTLTDDEAVKAFCRDVTIPVDLSSEFDTSTLLCHMKYGLAFDCPVDNEERVWMGSYLGNRKAVKKFLKQPPRALKRATDILRQMNRADSAPEVRLTEFQVDDVQAHIDQEELEMVDTPTNSVYDIRRFYDRMEESQRHVHAEINRRMKRRTTIWFGLAALLSLVIGMLPVFVMNRGESSRMMLLARTTGIALLCVAAAGIICLVVQRLYLRNEIGKYNGTMGAIRREVEADALQFSIYLSHACNFMRTTSALACYKEYTDGDYHKIRILQKHVADIDMNRAETADIFGEFLHYEGEQPMFDEAPFEYDFSRATDYAYPIQPMPDMNEQITFLQKGSTVEIPYGTIRELMLRREELYD